MKAINRTPARDPRTKEHRIKVYRGRIARMSKSVHNNNTDLELQVRLIVGMAELVGKMEQQIKQEKEQCGL